LPAVAPRLLLVVAVATGVSVAPARADIEGDSFVSELHGLRATLPAGWRITESSGYPRTLVWLSRSTPRIRIVLTVDPIALDCRGGAAFCNREPAAAAAALRTHLTAAGFQITSQEQTRTPELEYQTGHAYLRHAVIVIGDSLVSVIMAADSPSDRNSMGRTFDRITQSVRPLAPRP
jgi:hypothetical protein